MKKLINYEVITYIFSSGISFVTDIGIFYILVNFLGFLNDFSIVISAVSARVCSSFINYLINRNVVFKNGNNKFDKKTFIQYYILVIIQLLLSTVLTLIFSKIININVIIIKIVIDIGIFIVNFLIQKLIIFRKIN